VTETTNPKGQLVVEGTYRYCHGANYPWTKCADGKSNYGLDFGANIWGTHEGVSTKYDLVKRDFVEMASLDFKIVRWFVFCDGRGGITFDKNGLPVGLAENFFADMDAALEIAEETNIKLDLVLLNHSWMFDRSVNEEGTILDGHPEVLNSQTGREFLLRNIFLPTFLRYAKNPWVFAWEIMNEPDFIINGLDSNKKLVTHPMSMVDFKLFARSVADAVHTNTLSKVTIGGGRVKYLHFWDDDALGLDFLQVHPYSDFFDMPGDDTLYNRRYRDLKLKRPLVIGEFPTNADKQVAASDDHTTFRQYLDYCLHSGFAGSWLWSFNSVDGLGGPDRSILRQWAKNHADQLNPPTASA
jgi:hypothetical protein